MEIHANFRLVGLFVLATLLAAFRFAFFILAPAWTSDDVIYELAFATPAIGLSVGTPVYFNGLKVGEVTKIALPGDAAGANVLAKVDRATPIRTNTTARLKQTELMGAAFVSLEGASSAAPSLTALPGSTHPRLPVEDARQSFPDFRELWAQFSITFGKLEKTLNGVPRSLNVLKWYFDDLREAMTPLLQPPGAPPGTSPISAETLMLATDRLDRLVTAADDFVKSRKLEKMAEVSAKLDQMSSGDLQKLQRLAVDLRARVTAFDQKIRSLGLAPAGPAANDAALPRHK